MTIPEQRLTVAAIGDQRFGKSTAMGKLTKWALDSGQFRKAYLFVSPRKEEETIPKYPSEIVHVPGKAIRMSHVQHYHDSIIIAEDALRLDESSKKTVKELVSWLAGRYHDLVIVTTQKAYREYPAHTEIYFKWANNRFVYDIWEDEAHKDGIDWTSNSEPNVDPIIDALQNGVAKHVSNATKGKSGRPPNLDSLYSQCQGMFQDGKKPSDINSMKGFKAGSKEYQAVYVFYHRWIMRGKPGLKVDTLVNGIIR